MSTLPLMVQPPQFEDALSKLQKGMTLQQMAQARDLGQAQLKHTQSATTAQDLANQEAQLNLGILKQKMAAFQETNDQSQDIGPLGGSRSPAVTPPLSMPKPGVGAPPPGPSPSPTAPPTPGQAPVAPPPVADSAAGGPLAPQPPQSPPPQPTAQAPAPQPSAAPAASPSPVMAIPADLNGYYDRLAANYRKHGIGFMEPELRTQQYDLSIKQSKAISDAAAAHRDAMGEVTSGLVGIMALPPEQRPAAYLQLRPQLAAFEQHAGNDPNSLPPEWNDAAATGAIAQGMKGQDFATFLKTNADTANVAQEGIMKMAPQAHQVVESLLANTGSQAQLDMTRNYVSWLANEEKKANPKGTSFFSKELENIPTTYDSGLKLDAQLRSIPPKDRPEFIQKSVSQQAALVAAAASQGKGPYAAALADVDPQFAKLFTPVDKFDPNKTAEDARRVGMTANQLSVEQYKDQQLDILKLKTDIAQELAKTRESLMQQNIDLLKYQNNMLGVGGGGNSGATPPAAAGAASGDTVAAPKAQLAGEDYLKTLNPDIAARARSVIRGDTPLPNSIGGPRGVINNAVINAVNRADPDYSPMLQQKRKDTLKQFTNMNPSAPGGSVLALNTMVHHADLYLEAADALKNGTFRPGNAVYNTISTMMGHPAPTDANLIARFLSSETGKVATGGVPAEGEINGILKTMSTDASPDQLHHAGEKLLEIAAGRMIPLKETVDDAKLGKFVQVLKPDAQAILERRGFDSDTMKPLPTFTGGATKDDIGKPYLNNGKPAEIIDVSPDGKKVKFGPIGSGKKAATPAAPVGTPKAAVDKKYTEQQIREWAAAKNPPLDADDAVRSAREKGILA